MRARLCLLALAGCAPSSALELPEAPAGTAAIAILDGDRGALHRWPLARALTITSGEIQYYGALGAPPDGTPVLAVPGCADGLLPAPLAAWSLEGERASSIAPRALASPSLPCAGTGSIAFAPLAGASPCRRARITQTGCGIDVDFSECAQPSSRWALGLDGRSCGPAPRDEACSPVAPVASVAPSARCGETSYGLLPLRDARLSIERRSIRDFLAARPGGGPRGLSDFLVLPDRLVMVVGGVLPGYPCRSRRPTLLVSMDRGSGQTTAREGPPCLGALSPLADGGFLAVFRVEEPGTLGIGRFDAADQRVASATIAYATELDVVGDVGPGLFGLIDTTLPGGPEERTLILQRDDLHRPPDLISLTRIALPSLRALSSAMITGNARGAEVREREGLLLLSDDYGNALRRFRLPITDPPAEGPSVNGTPGSLEMGPLLVVRELRLTLVGRTGDNGQLEVFGDDDVAGPSAVAYFARDPEASVEGLFRLNDAEALALVHRRRHPRDLPEDALWAVPFEMATQAVLGEEAVPIGNERLLQARKAGDEVWAMLANAEELVRLRR